MDVSIGQIYISEKLNAIHIQDVYKYNIKNLLLDDIIY